VSADDLGLDIGVSTYDGTETTRWYNVCEEHSSAVGHQSLELAKTFAAHPTEWCEECREAVEERDRRLGL
jgi:hypothetical protein